MTVLGHPSRFGGADLVQRLVHLGDDVEAVEDVQRLGTFLADDVQMASSPFEGEWRGAHYAEESGRGSVETGQRYNLLAIM